MYTRLLLLILIHCTQSPHYAYLFFIFEILNCGPPLLYSYYSDDGKTLQLTASNVFMALVITAIILMYILCFLFKKPLNEKLDYLVLYAILAIVITAKGYIFSCHRLSGKDNDLDFGINMFGIAFEALKLCQDIFVSRWLSAKLVRVFQDLSTSRDQPNESFLIRLKELLFKKNS